jgi:hypothetical protein
VWDAVIKYRRKTEEGERESEDFYGRVQEREREL